MKIFADSFKLDPGIVRADTYTDHTFDSNPDPLKKGTVDFWNTMNEIGYLRSEEHTLNSSHKTESRMPSSA